MKTERVQFNINAPNEGRHRTQTFRSFFEYLGLKPGAKVVDLGAGPCIFAKLVQEKGLDVTAVDGRTERLPSDEELGSIKFVQADVRDFDLSGFDLIMILGLLYHLEVSDQKALLERCINAKWVIVDTQVHFPELVCTSQPERFGPVVRTDSGYEGIEFQEANNPMAALGNPKSFWHTEASLLRLFEDSGFRHATLVEPLYQSVHGARRFYGLQGY